MGQRFLSDDNAAMNDVYVESNGVRIAVKGYGGEGTPVVFIHGGPGPNLGEWDDFAPRLIPGFRPFAYDQRGHGQSSDAGEYSYESLSGDLHAVVEALELERVVVVGMSWGGWIALDYASRYECLGVVAVDGPVHGQYDRQSDAAWIRLEGVLRDAAPSRLFDFVGTEAELETLTHVPVSYTHLTLPTSFLV